MNVIKTKLLSYSPNH